MMIVFDCLFKEKINTHIEEIECKLNESESIYLTGGPISYSEIDNIIRSLKNKKAPGWDNVTSEHIKYSGVLIKSTITWVMNGIIKTNKIPNSCKRGILIPVPKPNKDTSKKDNNRGITLLPVLYKILEI